MKQKIFVVEDDTALQELYRYSLENEYDCRCYGTAAEFYDAIDNELPDLILLDIMLPGDDGFTILSLLKQQKTTALIPVIMVSAKGEELSKVKGLNLGADDYLAKPFGVLELVARIKANLRRRPIAATADIVYSDIVIDNGKHRITANGNSLTVTLKEYDLLRWLCVNAQRVQQRQAIFQEVWGESFMGETRTLDIHIKQLRKKLKAAQSRVNIETIRGVGYILS